MQLEDAYETLVSTQASALRSEPERRARRAVLAIASALLRRIGVEQSASSGHEPLTDLATILIAEVSLENPSEIAPALAGLFERAVGKRGRRELGAVYTPPHVVNFMVREALSARLAISLGCDLAAARASVEGGFEGLTQEGMQAACRMLRDLRLVDPAAGAGAFLVGAASCLADLADALQRIGMHDLGAMRTPSGALRRCCHGFEIDSDAATVASAVLAFATAGGRRGFAPAIVTQRNPLLDGMDDPSAPLGWDVVLMNPPYVGGKHVRARLGDDLSQALRKADGFSGDLLKHFLRRALASVRPGGVVSAIVSDTTFTIEAAAELRKELLEHSLLLSVAWCRPFRTVAVRGGVVTVARAPARADVPIEWFDAPTRASLAAAVAHRVPRSLFRALPGRPLYRPHPAARAIIKRWNAVESLDRLWSEVNRRGQLRSSAEPLERTQAQDAGCWTLLGTVVRSGQGLATGDDRRFVGFLAGTLEAQRAAERQRQLIETIRTDPSRSEEWRALRVKLSSGMRPCKALLELSAERPIGCVPGRKPFRVVDSADVRTSPLSEAERVSGIATPPSWVPYETSDRSSNERGAKWTRDANPVVIDWSETAVALLRRRRIEGPRPPVLRNEDMWFEGGVTHNRIASYLCARIMPENAIFSSESPVYVPKAPWLTPYSLLALLNAPVVEFALKTFLASRNHIEVGHVRRLPVPVFSAAECKRLDLLGASAVAAAAEDDDVALAEVEGEIDALTREFYGVRRHRLAIAR